MSVKCIIVLSVKSSGSSACQRFLAMTGRVRHTEKTRHFQNETLYWTKAASVLGLPQIRWPDSEVPLESAQARADLRQLLLDNVGQYEVPEDDEELIFDGWRALCRRYAPVFLEKSPHHLSQTSNLELIQRAIAVLPDIEFRVLGLVRNPIDTLYSAWRRWRADPEETQYQWLVAYRNLLLLKERLGDQLHIVRYEDMIASSDALAEEVAFIGGDVVVPTDYFHQRSIDRWKHDRLFGFSPAPQVIDTAMRFGYSRNSLTNSRRRFWFPYKVLARAGYVSLSPLRHASRRARARYRRA